MKTIAIIGAKGQLGKELQRLFKSERMLLIDTDNCDITDHKKTFDLLKRHKIDIIIHAAALTDVDGCEKSPELARKVNTEATQNIALMAKELRTRLIYISTDYVFDGENSNSYVETDVTCPINIYGKTKLDGESAVINIATNYAIARTAWLYGQGNNFIRKIIELAKTRDSLNVVCDQRGSPTYAKDLAITISQLAYNDSMGIFHCSNSGSASRFELAKEVVRLAGLKTDIIPVDSSAFPAYARRPTDTTLNCSKVITHGIKIRDWKEALSDYIENENDDKKIDPEQSFVIVKNKQ